MRLIKIAAPEGRGEDVAKKAFSAGIEKVSRWQLKSQQSGGKIETIDIVDIEASTPKAKRFIDALLAADFYRRDEFTISIRQPRSIISKTNLRELTEPFVEPASDILEELFQFSHITASFVGRVLVGAGFANIDDAGQRQLIGLAATAQIALVPVWFGIALVFGFPPNESQNQIIERAASFFLNTLTMIVVTFVIYTLTKAASSALKNIQTE